MRCRRMRSASWETYSSSIILVLFSKLFSRGNFDVWLSLESLKIDTKALRMSRERSNILKSSLSTATLLQRSHCYYYYYYYYTTTLCCRRRLNRLQQCRPRDRDRRIAGNAFSLGRMCLSSVLNPLVL